jgi:hypothetical protein
MENNIYAALAKAQGEFPKIIFSKKVDFKTQTGKTVNYSYAELSGIIEQVKEVLSRNSLCVTQTVETSNEKLIIKTFIYHGSGGCLESQIILPWGEFGSNKIQSAGGSLTYGRRYGLTMALCLAADEDDDAGQGEHVSPKQENKPQPEAKPENRQPENQEKPAASQPVVNPESEKLFQAIIEKLNQLGKNLDWKKRGNFMDLARANKTEPKALAAILCEIEILKESIDKPSQNADPEKPLY